MFHHILQSGHLLVLLALIAVVAIIARVMPSSARSQMTPRTARSQMRRPPESPIEPESETTLSAPAQPPLE
jgi:hypothetical protein